MCTHESKLGRVSKAESKVRTQSQTRKEFESLIFDSDVECMSRPPLRFNMSKCEHILTSGLREISSHIQKAGGSV